MDLPSTGCVILLKDGKKGIVRFVGGTHFSSGDWIGVELEGPDGKNDGSVKGERYFECEMDYGMFVRPAVVSEILERPPKPAAKGASSNGAPARARAQTGVAAGSAGTKKPGASDPADAKRHSVSASPSSALKAASQRPGLRVC